MSEKPELKTVWVYKGKAYDSALEAEDAQNWDQVEQDLIDWINMEFVGYNPSWSLAISHLKNKYRISPK